MNKNRGFSLIELIVVITIMAVITALVSVNFASAGKRGRDSRRMADLEKIRIALEMIRQVGTTYPAGTGSPPATALVPNYIQAIPTDPKSSSSYYYEGAARSYALYARVEDTNSETGSYGGNNCGGLECNYRVTNP